MAGIGCCEICGCENDQAPRYGDWSCHWCGQKYEYEEGHRIVLDDKQKAALLRLSAQRGVEDDQQHPQEGP
jgi:hypothetical protein